MHSYYEVYSICLDTYIGIDNCEVFTMNKIDDI